MKEAEFRHNNALLIWPSSSSSTLTLFGLLTIPNKMTYESVGPEDVAEILTDHFTLVPMKENEVPGVLRET